VNAAFGVVAVAVVTVATIVIGAYGLRLSRTTSDFFVASRTVSPLWNASAIGGEYLSAASFLGIAGLILAYGADMLWFPVGYTAGYLVLLVLVAAPLRRSGAYTLPDFAEARLESLLVRRIASVLVIVIGWLYLLPQFQSAGLTLRTVVPPAPVWLGGLVVAVVVILNVTAGGMRSITFVQAFQYWLKLTALAVPVVFLLSAWQADRSTLDEPDLPSFRERTTITVTLDVTVHVPETTDAVVTGTVDGRVHERDVVALRPGGHQIEKGTELEFPAGAPVPHVSKLSAVTNADWSLPLSSGRDHPLYATYSLILATFLGTMGLPHVLVRFYTNPDGRAARRTTLAVLGLLGLFYLLPTVYGALGRLYAADLLMTGRTDAVVLVLPNRMIGGLLGDLLSALTTAGAFAAFLSTSSGLAMSVTGVLSQDLLGPRGIRGFRLAGVLAVTVPFALALLSTALPVADMVGLAFAVAASSFCPLLILGIWWRRLTDAGAAAGLLVGGGLAIMAVALTISGSSEGGWSGALLAQPAAWTVPTAFLVMVVVSLLTPRRIAAGVARTMVRLHAPESLGLNRGDGPSSRRVRSPGP
jgi:Na+(H+)/acetate symporter ActP